MEAEVIGLAHSCRQVLPVIDMIAVLEEAISVPKNSSTMHVLIHKDNAGEWILTKTLPPQ